ncbi:anti-sigma factor domain-containing protein [Arthrobacter sp. NPDC090010]|uniref:anti-sigma factor n=1 Tax=Arthrobacter sp. NPDC090010 TaxID=3363942 RepID=UPI00381E790F
MDDQLHLLTGAYALNAVDDDERRRFEAAAAPGLPLTEEARELSQVAALLAAGTTPVAPPSGLKDRLMAQIAVTPQLEAAVSEVSEVHEAPAAPDPEAVPAPAVAPVVELDRRRRSSSPWLLAAAALLAVAAVGAGVWGIQMRGQRDEAVRQLAASQGTPAEALSRIVAAPDASVRQIKGPDGSTVLIAHSRAESLAGVMTLGMKPAPQGKSYELWLIDSAGSAKAAGLVSASGTTSTWNELPGGIGDAAFLGMTVEPAGGSPQPTTKPVLVEALG